MEQKYLRASVFSLARQFWRELSFMNCFVFKYQEIHKVSPLSLRTPDVQNLRRLIENTLKPEMQTRGFKSLLSKTEGKPRPEKGKEILKQRIEKPKGVT